MAKQKCYTLFAWAFAAVFALVLADVLFNNRTPYYEVKLLPALVCCAAAFGVLVVLWQGWKKLRWQPGFRLEIGLVAALLVGYLLVQMVFAFVLEVQPTRTWDFGLVFSAAQQYAQTGVLPADYFNQFHNNAPMYLVLVAVFKVLGALGVENTMPAALVCNVLCVNVSLLLLYRVLRHLYGVKNALFGLIGAFLFLPFLLYGPIVYTDTVTLPFPIGALALWLSARDRPAGAGRMLRCMGAGFLAAAGAWLKITVAIALVAAVLDALLYAGSRKGWKMAACMAVSFAALYTVLSVAALISPWLPAYDKEKAIPWQHWVMMGLSGDGGYNDADYKLTLQGEDYSARVQIAQSEIVRRIEEMGPKGLLSHGLDKLSYIFGDGLYYAPMKLDIGSVHKGNFLQEYFIQGMRHTGRSVYAALGIQVAMLAGLAAASVNAARRRDHRATVLRVAVLGLALFLLLWEARSRYLLNFLPVMLVAAFPAVDEGSQSV
ncbi:glycosyltransferase family 39 protein [uncultured Ruthenibacterium sp.]|uniref:glycosyltransferase family 39 protein n=1 Tax=uncultured Ruthenibacterium sp. TaxID=1905347 RepID=UPI00349E8A3A